MALIDNHRRRYTGTPLPPLPSSRVKKDIRVEPALDIPAGLQTQYVRKWESIPDKYIVENFHLEQYRQEKKKSSVGVPVFRTIIEQLINRPLAVTLAPPLRDAWDPDQEEEDREQAMGRQHVDGQYVTIEQLKAAFFNFISSEATLALFRRAKIHYIPVEQGRTLKDDDINSTEIFLCREDITYETDRSVLDRLKKEVFNKIVRWRRAKEKF